MNTIYTVSELQRLIEGKVQALPPTQLAAETTRQLILAEPLVSDADYPLSDLSAMDGFAVALGAKPGVFQIVGITLPGEAPLATPQPGEALQVFTGSALPEKVQVVMQEEVIRSEGNITIASLQNAGHVRRKGATARKGEIILPSGTLLTPAALAILSSVGKTMPMVIPRPRVAHLTTGSEVISPSKIPMPGEVRNTNATLIRALVEETGALYSCHTHCDESLESASTVCTTHDYATADLLLISGGSSGGDHDHSAELLQSLGFELLCRKVLCRPGKPFLFGIRGRQIAIGLPGNPLSHFVAFHLFVESVLNRLMGRNPSPLLKGRLKGGVALEQGHLETYWPARCRTTEQGFVLTPQEWLHSGHLTALAGVNALIRIPAKESPPKESETVEFLFCGNRAMNLP